MNNHRFIVFGAVMALLWALFAAPTISNAESAAKPGAAWEYKQVLRYRGWTKATRTVNAFGLPIPQTGYWWDFGEWTTSEDGTELPAGTDIKAVMARLGAAGWELVSVSPISSFAGDDAKTAEAGATSEMIYWLKRTKR